MSALLKLKFTSINTSIKSKKINLSPRRNHLPYVILYFLRRTDILDHHYRGLGSLDKGTYMKQGVNINNIKGNKCKASLTVEASLVLPLFIFFFIAFLYFIQIMTLQDILQEAITEAGLSMARGAYIYSDFQDVKESESFDQSLLDEGVQTGLEELTHAIINHGLIKYAIASKLDIDRINNSCIVGGFDGIRFDGSKLLEENHDIDIVARYRVRIPIHIFGLHDMDMIQRIRLRGWNGHQLSALYTNDKEGDKDTIVYITETGTVYHFNSNCSHISLSIRAINGKPTWQRNKNGGKYYPCESCCKNVNAVSGTYYITDYGDRYHIDRVCSRIKRTVKEIPLSEVGHRSPCKRCNK